MNDGIEEDEAHLEDAVFLVSPSSVLLIVYGVTKVALTFVVLDYLDAILHTAAV